MLAKETGVCVKSSRHDADFILHSTRRMFSICPHMYLDWGGACKASLRLVRAAGLIFKKPLSVCILSCPFPLPDEDATLNISLQSTVPSRTGVFYS